ncbi:unnamed protein product [Ranitomeya imitator]|uniref:Membrane protein BRI3 n=1 Tax=Ranitomeya imitator TaxID=111125 RepID=A0ABN9LK46_9NEOB|nr:unnamed protein product [Ranitomeya imitator]
MIGNCDRSITGRSCSAGEARDCRDRARSRVGVLEDSFTCLGIFCAVFFFPVGILFCFALRQRRCPNCGATFG